MWSKVLKMKSVTISLMCFAISVISANWTALYCSSGFPLLFKLFSVIEKCVPGKDEGINQNGFINVPVGAALYPFDLIAFLALPYFSVAVLRLPAFSRECLIAGTANHLSCKEVSFWIV